VERKPRPPAELNAAWQKWELFDGRTRASCANRPPGTRTVAPELSDFIEDLHAAGHAEHATNLAAFFDSWEKFHEHKDTGAWVLEQTDAMRSIARKKHRPASDRLAESRCTRSQDWGRGDSPSGARNCACEDRRRIGRIRRCRQDTASLGLAKLEDWGDWRRSVQAAARGIDG
jgi:hypothetical protein